MKPMTPGFSVFEIWLRQGENVLLRYAGNKGLAGCVTLKSESDRATVVAPILAHLRTRAIARWRQSGFVSRTEFIDWIRGQQAACWAAMLQSAFALGSVQAALMQTDPSTQQLLRLVYVNQHWDSEIAALRKISHTDATALLDQAEDELRIALLHGNALPLDTVFPPRTGRGK
jgi:hypothetical protein